MVDIGVRTAVVLANDDWLTQNIAPDFGFFPFMHTLASIVSGAMALTITLGVLVAVGGLILWGFGKFGSQSGRMQAGGIGLFVTGIAMIVLAVAAPALGQWAQNNIELVG